MFSIVFASQPPLDPVYTWFSFSLIISLPSGMLILQIDCICLCSICISALYTLNEHGFFFFFFFFCMPLKNQFPCLGVIFLPAPTPGNSLSGKVFEALRMLLHLFFHHKGGIHAFVSFF